MEKNYHGSVREVDVLAGENLLPLGCFLRDGGLYPGFGYKSLGVQMPSFTAMHIMRSGEGLLMQDNYEVYKISNFSLKNPEYFNTLIADDPVFIEYSANGKTDLLLCGNGTAAVLREGKCSYVPSFPAVRCAAVCCGRIFAADFGDGYRIMWSGTGGCEDWESGISGAGHLDLAPEGGPVYGLFSAGNELVAVRSHSVTVIAVTGSPESFRIAANIPCESGTVRHTAAAVGDKIYFMTGGGLCFYSNGKTSPVEGGLINTGSEKPYMAVSHLGRYYALIAKSLYYKADALFIYDTLHNAYSLINTTPENLSENNGELYVFTSKGVFGLAPSTGCKCYCGEFDFGGTGRKTLTEIAADCDGVLQTTVNGGAGPATFTGNVKRAGLRGSKFTVNLSCTGAVRSLKIKAAVR